MKSFKQGQIRVFLIAFIMSFSAFAADPETELKGVISPTDGYIKPVQFIVSIYRENGGTRASGSALQTATGSGNTQEKGKNTETMRIADGQAAFIGSEKEIPVPVVVAEQKAAGAANPQQAVAYKKLESGVELRPHLMGRYVQLELVEKDDVWNDQTQKIETNKIHSVVTLPLDQWSKVKGTLNDNEDTEDIYKTNRESGEELWVKIELAPN